MLGVGPPEIRGSISPFQKTLFRKMNLGESVGWKTREGIGELRTPTCRKTWELI